MSETISFKFRTFSCLFKFRISLSVNHYNGWKLVLSTGLFVTPA